MGLRTSRVPGPGDLTGDWTRHRFLLDTAISENTPLELDHLSGRAIVAIAASSPLAQVQLSLARGKRFFPFRFGSAVSGHAFSEVWVHHTAQADEWIDVIVHPEAQSVISPSPLMYTGYHDQVVMPSPLHFAAQALHKAAVTSRHNVAFLTPSARDCRVIWLGDPSQDIIVSLVPNASLPTIANAADISSYAWQIGSPSETWQVGDVAAADVPDTSAGGEGFAVETGGAVEIPLLFSSIEMNSYVGVWVPVGHTLIVYDPAVTSALIFRAAFQEIALRT